MLNYGNTALFLMNRFRINAGVAHQGARIDAMTLGDSSQCKSDVGENGFVLSV